MPKMEKEEEVRVPAWLVTFSDLMTLLLTFFVLLLSMSVIDNQRKLVALGSIRAAFGVIEGDAVPDSKETTPSAEQGVFKQDDAQDLLSQREQPKPFSQRDVEFLIDREQAIIRIADDVLFERGKSELSARGKEAVDRLLPLLLETQDVVKILGSTSTTYDELKTIQKKASMDLWRLSLQRALSIYTYIKARGVPVKNIIHEGIGSFHPHVKEKESASGLSKSRRTDFVFGKKDIHVIERMREMFFTKKPTTSTTINGFEFSLDKEMQ